MAMFLQISSLIGPTPFPSLKREGPGVGQDNLNSSHFTLSEVVKKNILLMYVFLKNNPEIET